MMQAPSQGRLLDLVFRGEPQPTGRELAGDAERAGDGDRLVVKFWGTRGGIARAGRDTVKYGGNTLCVTVEIDRERLFVFDAGTGMTSLGRFIAAQRRHYRYHVFISNPYWDHIQGLPYFEPLRLPGNEILVYGAGGSEFGLRQAIAAQRGFPAVSAAGPARPPRVTYRELKEGTHEIDQVQVRVIGLNHPGPALGYRLTSAAGKSVAYVTGNEVFPHCANGAAAARDRLVSFLRDVDVLIHDATYFDNEYREHAGSGHSSVTAVLSLAAEARAKRLYLFHHDPSHDDEAIGRMEMIARYFFEQRRLGIECWAAREGAMVSI
jgi:phosphoribosyl 1,2-cyclic phosphodiesterase